MPYTHAKPCPTKTIVNKENRTVVVNADDFPSEAFSDDDWSIVKGGQDESPQANEASDKTGPDKKDETHNGTAGNSDNSQAPKEVTPEQIREAILSLDAMNDGLWTHEGLPKTDAVGQKLGVEVLRRTINSAAEDLTREAVLEAQANGTGNSDSGSPE